MKKLFSFLLIFCLLPGLSGCGSIYSNYREVEQILAVQTIGVDYHANGVQLTMAAPSTAHKENVPVYLSGSGESISTAIEHIQNYSSEEELFCAHINHAVLGEDAAKQGVEPVLSYLCRSPEMRIDTPLYVVRDHSAEELITGVIESGIGICEVLQSAKTNAEERGGSTIFTAADVLCSLERYGSALLCALEYSPSDEVTSDKASGGSGNGEASSSNSSGGSSSGGSQGTSMTAAIAGYAVLKEGKLRAYIGREDAVAVGILLNQMGVSDLVVQDREGSTVTLELDQGSTKLSPFWDEEGTLQGLHFIIDAKASLLEAANSPSDVDAADYEDQITGRLEAAVLARVRDVLQLSQRLNADFLGLAGCVELADPVRFRNMDQSFEQLLGQLEMRVSVRGELSHTNNLKDV